MEKTQAKSNESQPERETPQAGTNKRHKVALLNESRGLANAYSEQRPLKKGVQVQKEISNRIEAEEYATKNQPVEKGKDNQENKRTTRRRSSEILRTQ